MDLPHGDEPVCVSPAIRSLEIRLNDSQWSSNETRAKGMRRLALAQLGSAGAINDVEFAKRVAELVISKQVPIALRAAAKIHPDSNHKAKLLDAAMRCEKEKTSDAASDADNCAASAASAASYAARAASDADQTLSQFAEDVVQILFKMKGPGCQWLHLTEAA